MKKSLLVMLLTAIALPSLSHAETSEIRIAKQYGINYLPLIVMEQNKLVEKHAKLNGLKDTRVSWFTFSGGAAMNDAILSNSLDVAAAGIAPAVTLWAKTRGDVKLIGALDSFPVLLNTRKPGIRTLRDFGPDDKIALPAVKVSIQAIILQLAAEKQFGEGQHNKLDGLTVTLAHPEAQSALLSGGGEINAHFGTPPYSQLELKKPGIHTVLNSADVLGAQSTIDVVYAKTEFRSKNPKLYQAFVEAYKEAIDHINADKHAAARLYLRVNKGSDSAEDIYKIISDPKGGFSFTPKSTLQIAGFLYKTGSIKQKPASWKDLYFPEVQRLPGS
jgi:NitT/TauT family transport system substrate-binding protein